MQDILKDYISRFPKKEYPKSSDFFTQLDINEYIEKLPFLFGIQNYCLRLLQALINNEKICIYSDYDTDAVTATGVMYWGLVELGILPEKIDYYAPDRFTEGYGMNTEAIEKLSKKYDLIVSVDCGINSIKEAEIVKNTTKEFIDSGGFKNSYTDLIITDHHHLHGDIPDCVGVINPRLGNYYIDNDINLDWIDEYTKSIEKRLSFQHLDLVENWLQKCKRRKLFEYQNKNNILSESVTGVGVAWFCLVWFGYFLEDLGFDKSKEMKDT